MSSYYGDGDISRVVLIVPIIEFSPHFPVEMSLEKYDEVGVI